MSRTYQQLADDAVPQQDHRGHDGRGRRAHRPRVRAAARPAALWSTELDWPTPDDLDLEVYRKGADGKLTEVGSSGNTPGGEGAGGDPERRAPGTYVLRVINFASVARRATRSPSPCSTRRRSSTPGTSRGLHAHLREERQRPADREGVRRPRRHQADRPGRVPAEGLTGPDGEAGRDEVADQPQQWPVRAARTCSGRRRPSRCAWTRSRCRARRRPSGGSSSSTRVPWSCSRSTTRSGRSCSSSTATPAATRFVELPAGLLDVPGEDPLAAAGASCSRRPASRPSEWTRCSPRCGPHPGSARSGCTLTSRAGCGAPRPGGFEPSTRRRT